MYRTACNCFILLLLFLFPPKVQPQIKPGPVSEAQTQTKAGEESGNYETRAQSIEAARDRKARELQPDIPDKVERTLVYVKDQKVLERITAGIGGLRLKLGSLATGSGFALGPEYFRRDLGDGNMVFRTSAVASLRGWYLADVQFTMPKLAGNRVFLDLTSTLRNFGGINYYGQGPDSSKEGRSNYRLEDHSHVGTLAWTPRRHVKVGLTGGYLGVNIGPGTDTRFVSAERIFQPATTPGIDRQTDFLQGGGLLQYDWRDNPGGPRRGGNYYARYTYYLDRDLGRHDFRRLDAEVQQYIPFFNERRVIALRGKSVTTYTRAGQTVPFYLQPVLGGSDDLRGFRPFRFYDYNLLVFNAEYRWETFSGLDMALFADAGKVFTRHSQWNLRDLEASYGVGMRFNVRNDVFMRIDVGFSHEGYQVWLKFNNVF